MPTHSFSSSIASLSLLFLLSVSGISAQTGRESQQASEAPAQQKAIRATLADITPVMDGTVVGDPAWATASIATGFQQRRTRD